MSPIDDTKIGLITNALYLDNKSCIQMATIQFGVHDLYGSRACKDVGTSLRSSFSHFRRDAHESLESYGVVRWGRCPLDIFLDLPGDEESDKRRQSRRTILILKKEMEPEDGVKGMMRGPVFPMTSATEEESMELEHGMTP